MEKADGIMTGDVDEELVKHLKRWNDGRPTKAQPATLPGIIATLQAMAPLLLSRLLRNCGFAHCITKRDQIRAIGLKNFGGMKDCQWTKEYKKRQKKIQAETNVDDDDNEGEDSQSGDDDMGKAYTPEDDPDDHVLTEVSSEHVVRPWKWCSLTTGDSTLLFDIEAYVVQFLEKWREHCRTEKLSPRELVIFSPPWGANERNMSDAHHKKKRRQKKKAERNDFSSDDERKEHVAAGVTETLVMGDRMGTLMVVPDGSVTGTVCLANEAPMAGARM